MVKFITKQIWVEKKIWIKMQKKRYRTGWKWINRHFRAKDNANYTWTICGDVFNDSKKLTIIQICF